MFIILKFEFTQVWNFHMVGVAQSVERQVVALVVAGSNPVAHPILQMMPYLLQISLIFAILMVFGCAQDPPGYPEYNVGVGLFQAGEYEEAAEHFQKAVDENPSFAEAYMNLGTSLYQLEMYEDALIAYTRADSLFRIGEYVEVRGVEHGQKVDALHDMMDVTEAQIKLLDKENLTEEEIEALKKKIEPLTE